MALRVGSGDVVAVVETFLEKKWTSVLTIAYSVEPDKPGAVGSATRTMDDLIWSVKPKITQEQRKQLIAKLPGLLATLNKWLDIIKWQDAERLQFFAELAECHASIVRAPIDLSPERQLEIALEVAQQDAHAPARKGAGAGRGRAGRSAAGRSRSGGRRRRRPRARHVARIRPAGRQRADRQACLDQPAAHAVHFLDRRAQGSVFADASKSWPSATARERVRMVRQDGVVARALAEAMGQGAVNDPPRLALSLRLPARPYERAVLRRAAATTRVKTSVGRDTSCVPYICLNRST